MFEYGLTIHSSSLMAYFATPHGDLYLYDLLIPKCCCELHDLNFLGHFVLLSYTCLCTPNVPFCSKSRWQAQVITVLTLSP